MKKIVQKRSVKHKWQKLLGFVCVLGVVLTSIIFTMNSTQEKEEVSAHPINPISIGNSINNTEYEVPVDAERLRELALTAQSPTYDDYVQGLSDMPAIVKGEVTSLWSNDVIQQGTSLKAELKWLVRDVRLTAEGNYFVLLGAYGQVTGGVHAVYIINPAGEIIFRDAWGNLTNRIERVETKMYSSSDGKSFLVGTTLSRFFKYILSNETSNSVIVNRVPVTTTGTDPKEVLGTGYLHVIDSDANIDDKVTLGSSVYFDNRYQYNADSSLLFRIPVATISIGGWQNAVNPGFAYNTIHEYSLETFIPQGAEDTSGRRYGHVEQESSSITPNHIYGSYSYEEGTGGGITMKTVQIFDKNDTFYEKSKPVKRRKVLYENRSSKAEIYILNELCTDNEIYFVSTEETESKLIKIELFGPNAYDVQVLKRYPKDSILNFVKNPDDPNQLFYFGSTGSLTGEFYHPILSGAIPGNCFYVQGITDRSFERLSFYAMSIDSPIQPDFMKQGEGKALIFGRTPSSNVSFVDKHYQVGETGAITEATPTFNAEEAFIGSIESQTDYPPAVKTVKDIEINIAHKNLNSTVKNSNGWNFLDNWLITGKENGDLNNVNAINVYDYMDSREAVLGQEWLNKRINRNPLDITGDIEWGKLGFDKTKAGAQLVTYFVTDSQNQPTVISRWVNKKTYQTIEKEDYCLDAQNFHIPLDGIGTSMSSVDKFKELAKTMAWNSVNHDANSGEQGNGLDEDGAGKKFSDAKVEADPNQLAALQAAKVAKPYPVDVTYKPDGNTEIVNRVWVFVTKDNTVPNTETGVTPADTKGVVIYADDYMIPYRSRLDQDLDSVLADGKVKAYNYYAKDRTAELAPLPDSSSVQSNWNITDLNVIHDPFTGGTITLPTTVTPELTYKWSGASDSYHTQGDVTKATLDVTLTGDILLNVRQVIQGTNDQLKEFVVPTEGYLSIHNTLNNNGTPAVDSSYQSQVTVASGKKADNPDFNTFGVDIEHLDEDTDLVDLSAILPSFYMNVGYSISNDKASHPSDPTSADTKISLSRGDIYDQGEYWITIYLEPNGTNGGNPQPYSWDYKHNDLGRIVNP